jgi:hypothetical protein
VTPPLKNMKNSHRKDSFYPLFTRLFSGEGMFDYMGCDNTEHRGQMARATTLIGILLSLAVGEGPKEHVL